MYRFLLLLLLSGAVAPAPQSVGDSDITYVMLQPPVKAPTAPSHSRESRIENLPLTIPGNVTLEDPIAPDNHPKIEELSSNVDSLQSDVDATLPESSNLSEITVLPEIIEEKPEKTIPEPPQIYAPEETELPEKTDNEKPDETLPEITDITEKEELLEAHGSDVSDTVPSESNQSRRGRTYESSETTDIFEEATVRYDDVTQIPEFLEPKTKATPEFVPKLSYFQKPQGFVSFPTNSLEKSARRRFRSHCRCEKIWNCPKLQISVPRCPNEYFLCCF